MTYVPSPGEILASWRHLPSSHVEEIPGGIRAHASGWLVPPSTTAAACAYGLELEATRDTTSGDPCAALRATYYVGGEVRGASWAVAIPGAFDPSSHADRERILRDPSTLEALVSAVARAERIAYHEALEAERRWRADEERRAELEELTGSTTSAAAAAEILEELDEAQHASHARPILPRGVLEAEARGGYAIREELETGETRVRAWARSPRTARALVDALRGLPSVRRAEILPGQ
jgi:hypothetical protein